MKKKLNDAKGMWSEYLPKILWSCHTTPHSNTKEMPSNMVYGTDTMLQVDIGNAPLVFGSIQQGRE